MDNGWLNRSQFLLERTDLENLHLKVVDTLGFNPDIIILDPPRDGIYLKALPKILESGAEKIVYISCKPTSFVRDLKVMEAAGYRMEKCVGVDMFPNTVNCEAVVMLVRKRSESITNHPCNSRP